MDECRKQFEAVINRPPYEQDISRYPDSSDAMWTGSYKVYQVQLAWCAWKAAWNRRSCDRDAVIEKCWQAIEEIDDGEAPEYRACQEAISALKSQPADDRIAQMERDAARYRKGWTHSCNVLTMEIELWIPHCPHCGRPAPIDAAMQSEGGK